MLAISVRRERGNTWKLGPENARDWATLVIMMVKPHPETTRRLKKRDRRRRPASVKSHSFREKGHGEVRKNERYQNQDGEINWRKIRQATRDKNALKGIHKGREKFLPNEKGDHLPGRLDNSMKRHAGNEPRNLYPVGSTKASQAEGLEPAFVRKRDGGVSPGGH